MIIVDIQAQPVEACCQFDYKGLVISASTVFRPHSVLVFLSPRDAVPLSPELGSVEAAIAWIDEWTTGRAAG